jgi:fructose-1,6-bisphosphatase/inositol monophosphatase family enzyme
LPCRSRSRAAAGGARSRRAGLSAAYGREFLGGKGQGRLVERPTSSRVVAARPRRSAGRDGIPYKAHGDLERWRKILDSVSPEVAGIRRYGSAALDLAWVAAGRYDGFWEEDLQLWDIAAGILLVREAGGFVSDWRGADRALETGQVLATNDGLQTRLHKLVAGALRG